jgi:hypothetical protein
MYEHGTLWFIHFAWYCWGCQIKEVTWNLIYLGWWLEEMRTEFLWAYFLEGVPYGIPKYRLEDYINMIIERLHGYKLDIILRGSSITANF